ncbi:MAG TPA: TIGR02530 family flagellar biosynthesis protein [Bacillota bacterium]|nr:TIGR02530 family flagellar biosynthesis protein [Bacillota bacterium]
MNRDVNSIIPVGGTPAVPAGGRKAPAGEGGSFEKVFQKELERDRGLKFSAHAERRLKERNIALAGEDLARIDRAVRRAAAKGARDSLIIYGDLALIASVLNRTVVTAMDSRLSEDHVFTNIDSAVIVK